MGTFHDDKGELHGITVVVVTKGPRVWVGRCDEQTPEGIILMDADHHDDGENGKSSEQYLEFASKYGVFKKHDRVVVPNDDVVSVSRLGKLR